MALDGEAGKQLIYDQVDLAVQRLEENVDIAVRENGETGQVDGREGKIAAAVGNGFGRIIDVADDSSAAAHISDLGLGMSFLVESLVEGRILEGEVREEALGADAAGQLEEIVVRLAFVVVDAFLDAEDLDREDRRFAVSQTGFRSEQHVPYDHAAFRGSVHAVVDGRERSLRAGSGMHGVEVVDESFHRLVRFLIRFLIGLLGGEFLGLLDLLGGKADLLQLFRFFKSVFLALFDGSREALLFQTFLDLGRGFQFLGIKKLYIGEDVLAVLLGVGLLDARSQTVVEVDYGLSAVLVVLVRLDGDAGQGGIAGDGIRFSQNAVSGREAALEELKKVDLTTGGGQRVEVHVVDVNVAFSMRLGVLGLQDEHFIELLGAFAAVLQHGAHRGVAVDVGVLSFDIAVAGILESNIFIDLHQPGIHLAHSASVRAIQYIGFSGTYVTGVDKDLFHHVLDALDIGDFLNSFFHSAGNFGSQFGGGFFILGEPGSGKGFFDSAGNLALVERHSASVTFYDFADHIFSLISWLSVIIAFLGMIPIP